MISSDGMYGTRNVPRWERCEIREGCVTKVMYCAVHACLYGMSSVCIGEKICDIVNASGDGLGFENVVLSLKVSAPKTS